MLSAIALLAVLLPLPQATRPLLAGVWVGDTERLQIRLQGDSLTLTKGSQEPMTYRLDGSVSRNSSKTAASTVWNHESTARWVGNAVLIVTKTTRENGASWEWLTIYSIDSETGRLTADGHNGRSGARWRRRDADAFADLSGPPGAIRLGPVYAKQ